MPYIKTEDRTQINAGRTPSTPGELNYQIFSYLVSCMNENKFDFKKDYNFILLYVKKFIGKNPNYQKYNDMVGCLTCCYKEFKRRYFIKVEFLLEIVDSYDTEIANYEKIKIKENGDV